MNGVFYALGSYEEGEKTISEIYRVLEPSGTAYFGEIPTRDENLANTPKVGTRTKGILKTVLAKLRRHDIKTIVQWLRSMYRSPAVIIPPNTFLYWSEEDFTSLLEKHGFTIQSISPHFSVKEKTSRLNFIVTRPK